MPTQSLDMNCWHLLRKSPRREDQSQLSGGVQHRTGRGVQPPETSNFAGMPNRLDELRRFEHAG
jgi:hypothetical protein